VLNFRITGSLLPHTGLHNSSLRPHHLSSVGF
jgi:hypothetical protein